MKHRKAKMVVSSIIALAASQVAHATTIYWTGDVPSDLGWDKVVSGPPVNTNWSTSDSTNTDYGKAPTSSDDLVFDTAFTSTNFNTIIADSTATTAIAVKGITVQSGVGNITFGPPPGAGTTLLEIGSDGLAVNGGNLTISAREMLTTTESWSNTSGNAVVLTNLLTGTSQSQTLELTSGAFTSQSTMSTFTMQVDSGATYKIQSGGTSTMSLFLNGGTLDANAATGLLFSFLSGSGTISNFASTGNFDIDFFAGSTSANTATYTGNLGGFANLNIRGLNNTAGTTGGGTQVFTGVLSFTGNVAIGSTGHSASLQLDGGNNRLPVGTVVSFGTNNATLSTDKLILGGSLSAVSQTIAGVAITSGANINASIVGGNAGVSTLTINNPGNVRTFAGIIGGTGTFENNIGIGKMGASSLTLGGANTYTGGTSLNAGTLNFAGAGTLGDVGGALTITGGTLDLSGTNQGVGNLTGSVGAITNNTTATSSIFTIGNGNATGGNFTGVISDHVTGGTTGTIALVKTGTGTLSLGGTNTFTGGTAINGGQLVVNGSLASAVSIAGGASLGGAGKVNAAISGAGQISPGSGAGILTATQIDPSTGTDFAFEFTQTGSPTYGTAGASGNDVLHLTNTTTPLVSALNSSNGSGTGNEVDVYFSVASLSSGDVFKGGFYTDGSSDFLTLVGGATFDYFVKGDGQGTHLFNGQDYYTLGEFNSVASITLSTVAETANFGGGNVNGRVAEFTVAVPEPGTIGLAGIAAVGALMRRRRRA